MSQIDGVSTLSMKCQLSSSSTNIFLDTGKAIRGRPTRSIIQLFANSDIEGPKRRTLRGAKGIPLLGASGEVFSNGVILEQTGSETLILELKNKMKKALHFLSRLTR
jgi:hypothetical protein